MTNHLYDQTICTNPPEYPNVSQLYEHDTSSYTSACVHFISFIQTPDIYLVPLLLSQYTRDILLKLIFLTISVQKCILNLKQNNIYYGVLT